ncbi:MAG: DUF4145 domain-containing protein [Janthinobacterium lividum]
MAHDEFVWSHCNECARSTKHDHIAERVQHGEDQSGWDNHYTWTKTSAMLECRGCESISMRVDWWHSEYDASDDIDYYPPRVSRKPPVWQSHLPADWQSMLREIYTALHANSRSLAIMGARALVDMYMNDAVGDIGGFAKKLSKLVTDGHLSKQDKEILDVALEAGHAAAHRGHTPTAQEVAHVMDIVENLLQKFALRNHAAELSKGTPRRLLKQDAPDQDN